MGESGQFLNGQSKHDIDMCLIHNYIDKNVDKCFVERKHNRIFHINSVISNKSMNSSKN